MVVGPLRMVLYLIRSESSIYLCVSDIIYLKLRSEIHTKSPYPIHIIII